MSHPPQTLPSSLHLLPPKVSTASRYSSVFQAPLPAVQGLQRPLVICRSPALPLTVLSLQLPQICACLYGEPSLPPGHLPESPPPVSPKTSCHAFKAESWIQKIPVPFFLPPRPALPGDPRPQTELKKGDLGECVVFQPRFSPTQLQHAAP